MSIEDLWGEIPSEGSFRLPITILKEQATRLGDKTNRILEATVETSQDVDGRISHNFYIVAPALSNFRYLLLTAAHNVAPIYPVFMQYVGDNGTSVNGTCNDEETFIGVLRHVLSSRRTVNAIMSLQAQSKSAA